MSMKEHCPDRNPLDEHKVRLGHCSASVSSVQCVATAAELLLGIVNLKGL